MAESQEIGPWQDAWLRTLESGIFKQGRGALARRDSHGNWELCALGLAYEVAIENGERFDLSEDPEGIYTVLKYDGHSTWLSPRLITIFKFYSNLGHIQLSRLPINVVRRILIGRAIAILFLS